MREEEETMLDGALGHAHDYEDDGFTAQPYFDEVVGYLAPCVRDALVEDVLAYDRTGVVSPLMEDMLRRARCLAAADRIVVNLVPAAIAA
jgi:hypothetical protein